MNIQINCDETVFFSLNSRLLTFEWRRDEKWLNATIGTFFFTWGESSLSCRLYSPDVERRISWAEQSIFPADAIKSVVWSLGGNLYSWNVGKRKRRKFHKSDKMMAETDRLLWTSPVFPMTQHFGLHELLETLLQHHILAGLDVGSKVQRLKLRLLEIQRAVDRAALIVPPVECQTRAQFQRRITCRPAERELCHLIQRESPAKESKAAGHARDFPLVQNVSPPLLLLTYHNY